MFTDMTRGTHDNDNEEFSFVSLAALTANVVRYLETDKQKEEAAQGKRQPRHSDEEECKKQLEYVERRLADLRAFERIAMYGKRRKRE